MLTFEQVKADPEVVSFISHADKALEAIGYTKHGAKHVSHVAKAARKLLRDLGFHERTCELAAIAGLLHDIGNAINRTNHAQSSACLANAILARLGMDLNEKADVVTAIGNHHEEDGSPVSPISAALILADKSDVHRYRVRTPESLKLDIHDRVNYAVTKSWLVVTHDDKTITLDLTVDTNIASVMEYFEIFMPRMLISRKSADFLGFRFALILNGTRMV
jgi:metal-dependent HD superfamily phosphatase/phosphodiesterase